MVEVRTIRDVDLLKVGTFNISTGAFHVTPEMLQSVVDAHNAGALHRKPVIKIGHDDPRFFGDGSPALGYVDNMRVIDNGQTLIGDYVNVPLAVAKVLNHAWPDRSGEWQQNYRDRNGNRWPCVLHAVALLGSVGPGITTLKSLQDVLALYEDDTPELVAAASAGLTSHAVFTASDEVLRTLALAAARRRRALHSSAHSTTI